MIHNKGRIGHSQSSNSLRRKLLPLLKNSQQYSEQEAENESRYFVFHPTCSYKYLNLSGRIGVNEKSDGNYEENFTSREINPKTNINNSLMGEKDNTTSVNVAKSELGTSFKLPDAHNCKNCINLSRDDSVLNPMMETKRYSPFEHSYGKSNKSEINSFQAVLNFIHNNNLPFMKKENKSILEISSSPHKMEMKKVKKQTTLDDFFPIKRRNEKNVKPLNLTTFQTQNIQKISQLRNSSTPEKFIDTVVIDNNDKNEIESNQNSNSHSFPIKLNNNECNNRRLYNLENESKSQTSSKTMRKKIYSGSSSNSNARAVIRKVETESKPKREIQNVNFKNKYGSEYLFQMMKRKRKLIGSNNSNRNGKKCVSEISCINSKIKSMNHEKKRSENNKSRGSQYLDKYLYKIGDYLDDEEVQECSGFSATNSDKPLSCINSQSKILENPSQKLDKSENVNKVFQTFLKDRKIEMMRETRNIPLSEIDKEENTLASAGKTEKSFKRSPSFDKNKSVDKHVCLNEEESSEEFIPSHFPEELRSSLKNESIMNIKKINANTKQIRQKPQTKLKFSQLKNVFLKRKSSEEMESFIQSIKCLKNEKDGKPEENSTIQINDNEVEQETSKIDFLLKTVPSSLNLEKINETVDTNKKTFEYEPSQDMFPDNAFTENDFQVLEKLKSPLLADLECREYLKNLINQSEIKETKVPTFEASENFLVPSQELISSKQSRTKKKICSQKENIEFWENIWETENSQITPNSSENFFLSTPESNQQRSSQSLGLEIYNFASKADFSLSQSKMDNALKNMNKLSQQSLVEEAIVFEKSQRSNKLLEIGLKIYTDRKNKFVPSGSQLKDERIIRNKVEIKKEDDLLCFALKEGPNRNCGEIHFENKLENEFNDQNIEARVGRNCSKDIYSGLKKICEDKSLLYDENVDCMNVIRPTRAALIEKINRIFEYVQKKLEDEECPVLRIKRQTWADCSIEKKRLTLVTRTPSWVEIKYKNKLSKPKFCLMMYLLAKILALLDDNLKLTKREIFYQAKDLIIHQGKIDCALKAISCMLSAGPWDLNIIAQKGLVYGNMKLTMAQNEVINCNIPGTLIPQDVDEIVEIKCSASFILVVEKESIFVKLISEDLPNRLTLPFIMITGKGFPDLNTQLFLKKLWMIMSIPVFIFTDSDPHGINIMLNYRFGSLANAHISDQLAVPKAKWLGFLPSEIEKLGTKSQSLTERERRVVNQLLKTPFIPKNPRIFEELKIMFGSNRKAGIEDLIKNDNFLSEYYFPMKFCNNDSLI